MNQKSTRHISTNSVHRPSLKKTSNKVILLPAPLNSPLSKNYPIKFPASVKHSVSTQQLPVRVKQNPSTTNIAAKIPDLTTY